jgi:Domain of unknown function (DUF6089)
MRKAILLLIVVAALQNTCKAQYVYLPAEYGFGVGAAQYFGDLNQNQSFNYVRYCANAFYKHNYNPYISIKGGLAYALLGGADKFSKSVYEKSRNLSFENNVFEATVSGEFNFFKYEVGEPTNKFTPYINFGLGVMYTNPYANFNGTKYFLKPLATEGQLYSQYKDRKYSNVALVLPVGMGVKYWMTAGTTFSFEISNRFTSTDYLDDVSATYVGKNLFPDNNPPYVDPAAAMQDRSVELGITPIGVAGRQRGVSSTKDQYLMAIASFSIRLRDYTCPNQ